MSRPRVNLPFFDRHFLKSGQLFLWGEIEDYTARQIVQSMRFLADQKVDTVRLYIHSDGGCVDSTIAIIDEMERLKREEIIISTICQSKAYSAAAYILAMGTPGERYATPNSAIMLHPVSYDLPTDYITQQQKVTEFYAKQVDQISRLVANACGYNTSVKYKKFCEMIDQGLWLTAKEAKKMKVIDGLDE